MPVLLLSLLLADPALAGDEAPPAEAAAEAATEAAPVADPLLQALDLPVVADDLRDAGVPAAEVDEALQASKGAGMAPGDVADVLTNAGESVKENGRIDNFGSFVKSKVDEGLRGKDLADAIHAEHAARGMGKGEHGKHEGAEEEGEHGKPDDKGEHGKPGDKGGKPDEAGAKGGKGKAGGGK